MLTFRMAWKVKVHTRLHSSQQKNEVGVYTLVPEGHLCTALDLGHKNSFCLLLAKLRNTMI